MEVYIVLKDEYDLDGQLHDKEIIKVFKEYNDAFEFYLYIRKTENGMTSLSIETFKVE